MMKNKILTLVIGMLIGAIIASVGFYFYEKNNSNHQSTMGPSGDRPQMMQGENNGTPPQMKGGMGNNQQGNSSNQTTPPEKPSGEQGNNQGTPPALPSDSNMQTQQSSNS